MERTIKRTRRFKALECGTVVEKISLYDQNDERITTRIIQVDKDGKEYYYMPNFYHDGKLFSNRPKDAIDTIKAGFGDAILCHNIFAMNTVHVVRFIDREYGEELRRKTLEGWKNTKFAYGINIGSKNSFSNGRIVDIDEDLDIMNKELKPLYFETEQDAQDYIDKMIKKATYYRNEYKEICNKSPIKEDSHNQEHYELVYKPYVERIGKIIHFTIDSFLWNLFAYLSNPDDFYVKTIQVIIKED